MIGQAHDPRRRSPVGCSPECPRRYGRGRRRAPGSRQVAQEVVVHELRGPEDPDLDGLIEVGVIANAWGNLALARAARQSPSSGPAKTGAGATRKRCWSAAPGSSVVGSFVAPHSSEVAPIGDVCAGGVAPPPTIAFWRKPLDRKSVV